MFANLSCLSRYSSVATSFVDSTLWSHAVVHPLRASGQNGARSLYPCSKSGRNVSLPQSPVVKLVADLKEPPWPRVQAAPSLFVLLP